MALSRGRSGICLLSPGLPARAPTREPAAPPGARRRARSRQVRRPQGLEARAWRRTPGGPGPSNRPAISRARERRPGISHTDRTELGEARLCAIELCKAPAQVHQVCTATAVQASSQINHAGVHASDRSQLSNRANRLMRHWWCAFRPTRLDSSGARHVADSAGLRVSTLQHVARLLLDP